MLLRLKTLFFVTRRGYRPVYGQIRFGRKLSSRIITARADDAINLSRNAAGDYRRPGLTDESDGAHEDEEEAEEDYHQRGENSGNNSGRNNSYRGYAGVTVLCVGAYCCFHVTYNSGRIKKVFAFAEVGNNEKEASGECSSGEKVGEFRDNLETYKSEQVGKHDNIESGIWITYKHGVYDITDFVSKHPGGAEKIMMAAGSSIEPFWEIYANHKSPEIYRVLESMRIGNIAGDDEASSPPVNSADGHHDPYCNEPKRHKSLKINGPKPFCAEPPPSILAETFITPLDLFYVRNHLPVPNIVMDDYALEVAIEEDTKKILDLEDIKKFPKYTITSAIMCGGNRRSEMAEAKPLRGLSWGIGAVGNATWSGARLSDVLKDLNINENDWAHVQFQGLDVDPSGVGYGASIPISKALDPRGDVLLAYEMNGQAIPLDHGYPIRVIVPGVVGARNVKWLGKIVVSKEESTSHFQRNDYKAFSPSVDWDTVDFSDAPAIQEMPVISAICTPQVGETIKLDADGKLPIKGYAWSGGGRKIIRVDVTVNGGETWHVAKIIAQDPTAKEARHWSWSLWTAEIPVDGTKSHVEIWAKAVDSAYNVQPESFKNIWNLRGFLCNAYHRVRVTLER